MYSSEIIDEFESGQGVKGPSQSESLNQRFRWGIKYNMEEEIKATLEVFTFHSNRVF